MGNQHIVLTHSEKLTPMSELEQKLAQMSQCEYMSYINRTQSSRFIADPRKYAQLRQSQRNSQRSHSQAHNRLKARLHYQQVVRENIRDGKYSDRVTVVAGSRQIGDLVKGKQITGFGKAWPHKETGVMFCYAYLR